MDYSMQNCIVSWQYVPYQCVGTDTQKFVLKYNISLNIYANFDI